MPIITSKSAFYTFCRIPKKSVLIMLNMLNRFELLMLNP